MSKIAVVAGGNRGLGFEIARQLAQAGNTVVIGARDPGKGEQAAALPHGRPRGRCDRPRRQRPRQRRTRRR